MDKYPYLLLGIQLSLPFVFLAWLVVHRMNFRPRKRDRFAKHFEEWK